MKCQKCDDGRCEVRFDIDLINKANQSYDESIWTDQEISIILGIYELAKESSSEWFPAYSIAKQIDSTSHIVAARCIALVAAGYIQKKNGISPYKYNIVLYL